MVCLPVSDAMVLILWCDMVWYIYIFLSCYIWMLVVLLLLLVLYRT